MYFHQISAIPLIKPLCLALGHLQQYPITLSWLHAPLLSPYNLFFISYQQPTQFSFLSKLTRFRITLKPPKSKFSKLTTNFVTKKKWRTCFVLSKEGTEKCFVWINPTESSSNLIPNFNHNIRRERSTKLGFVFLLAAATLLWTNNFSHKQTKIIITIIII